MPFRVEGSPDAKDPFRTTLARAPSSPVAAAASEEGALVPAGQPWRMAMRVLVIGAGPGGAAAAGELARGGADVRVVEKARWPRPKTCGDGISPPGVREASALGVDLGDCLRLERGEISTPAGHRFSGGWRPETPWGTIVERNEFDARLMRAAIAAGARFDDGVAVCGIAFDDAGPRATFRSATHGETVPERFDAVVLAEGATGTLAPKLGFGCHASRLVALRGYAPARAPLVPQFGLYFDRDVSPGYGWVFPVDAGRANVGVLVDERAVRRRGGDLRGLLRGWLATSAAARETLGPEPALERVSGGVIPTGRRRRVRGGVYLVGDAAGVADPFSAEGIYQAMATGRAAAAALLEHGPTRAAERGYAAALRPFDRNAREARRLRLGFSFVIDPLGRRAVDRPRLAQHFSASGFFMKDSLPAFLWGIVRAW
jgi:geranylgeranyl reductase family protein